MVFILLIVYQPTSTCGIKRKSTKRRRTSSTARAKVRLQRGPIDFPRRRQQARMVLAPKDRLVTKTSLEAEVFSDAGLRPATRSLPDVPESGLIPETAKLRAKQSKYTLSQEDSERLQQSVLEPNILWYPKYVCPDRYLDPSEGFHPRYIREFVLSVGVRMNTNQLHLWL